MTTNGNPNEHSLEAEILLDFTQAATTADDFKTKIAGIADAFDKISTKVKSIDNSTGAKLKQILAQIEQADNIDLPDVDGIKEKIENAIAKSIANADINIKGLNGEAFSIGLDDDNWNKVKKTVETEVNRAFKGINLEQFDMGTVKLHGHILNSLQGRFQKELKQSIENTLNFDFKDIDGKVTKFKLDVKAEHMQGMMNAVRDKFLEQLSNPALINIEGVGGEITIIDEQMKKVYLELSEKMQRLSESIKIDTTPFDQILQMKLDPQDFSKKLNDLFKQVELVNASLNSIALTASEDDMKNFLGAIKTMKSDLIHSLNTFIASVRKQVGSIKGPDTSGITSQLNNLNTVIDSAVGARFDAVINSILLNMDGKDLVIPALRRLEEALVNAAKNVIPTTVLDEALKSIHKSLVSEAGRVAQALADHSKQSMSTEDSSYYDRLLFIESKNLLDAVVNQTSRMVRSFTEGLKDTDFQSFSGPEKDRIHDDMNAAMTHVIANFTNVLRSIVGSFTLVSNAFKSIQETAANAVADVVTNAGPGNLDFTSAIDALDRSINSLINNRMSSLGTAMSTVNAEDTNQFRVAVKGLDSEVRKIIAEKMQMSVADLKKINDNTPNKGHITGPDALKTVAEGNIEAVFRKFHAVINKKATEVVDQYGTALDAVDIAPDLSTIPYLIKKFEGIQEDISLKVRQLLDHQFTALADAIKGIQANPISLGYTPKDLPTPKVSSSQQPRQYWGGANSVSSRKSGGGSTSGGGRMYYPIADYGMSPSEQKYQNPGGDTKSFMGSVINTMRYMTAGMIMGGPSMLLYDAWNQNKEYDYQMTRAKVNVMAKGFDPANQGASPMIEPAQRRVDEMIKKGEVAPADRDKKVESETNRLDTLVRFGGVDRAVQNIARAYALDLSDAGRAYQEATRKYNDPEEALVATRSAAKIRAIEEVDVAETMKGLTALGTQWGLKGTELNDVSNMLIAAANTKFTSVEALLDVQKRSGSIFAQYLPDMTKRDALASSIGLSSLYTEATGRAGGQGGTFFKNVLTSPYNKVTLKYLEEISQSNDPKLQALNPYTERTNNQGEKVFEQKNGLDMLLAITDSFGSLDDKTKSRLMEVVAKSWFKGDMTALTANMDTVNGLFEDMEKISGNKGVQANGGVRQFFKDLQGSPESLEQMTEMITATMMDSWKFRTQRVKTDFQVASTGVFDELKDEFGQVASELSVILRLIRENAGLIADTLSLATKAVVAFGGRYMVGKAMDWHKNRVEDKRQRSLGAQYDKYRYHLNEEGRMANLNRMIVLDKRADVQARLDRATNKRGLIGDIDGYQKNLGSVNSQILQKTKLKEEMEQKEGYKANPKYQKLNDELTDLDLQKRHLERRVDVGGQFAPKQDAEIKGLEKELRELDRKFKEVDKQAMSVNNRMDLVDQSMQDSRVSTKHLTTEMHRVATGMDSAGATSGGLSERIHMIGRASNLSKKQINQLVTEVDKLNDEFETGKLPVDEYIRKLRELERLHRLQNTKIMDKPSTDRTGKLTPVSTDKSLFGNSLVNAVMGYGLLKGVGGALVGPGTVAKKPGIMSRMKSAAAGGFGAKAAVDFVKGNGVGGTLKSGAAGVGGGLLKGLKGAGSLLKGAKGIPYLGLALTGMDVFSNLLAPLTMTDGERLDLSAGNRRDLAHTAANTDKMSWLNPMKYIQGGMMGMNFLTDGLINKAGGTTASFGDYIKAWGAMKGNDGDALKAELENQLGYQADASNAQALITKERMEADKSIDLNGDGIKGDTEKTDWREVKSYEEGKQMLTKLQSDLGRGQATANAQFESERAGLLIRGVREDSQEMRNLLREFFEKNITVLDEAIAAAKERQSQVTPGTEAYKAVQEEIDTITADKEKIKVQQYQNETSVLDATLSEMDRKLRMNALQSDIQKSNVILGGAKEDSAAVRLLDSQKLNIDNQQLEMGKSELAQLMKQFGDKEDMRLKIEEQMLQIEAQQRDNLVNIRKALEKEKATFNVPEGIQAMSYYESRVKDSTHKNLTVGAGDVNVNVTIDTMSGSSADIQKMADAVGSAVKKVQVDIARELGQQVRSGMQNNYRG